MHIANLTLFIIGYIFGFFGIGFVLIELFYPKLNLYIKIPLYILLSVTLSTYIIYIISSPIGLSTFSIILSYLPFAVLLPKVLNTKKRSYKKYLAKHKNSVSIAFLIFVAFFVSLYTSIFYPYKNNFVLSPPNWQDTAMHIGIIESIAQGNFPPAAPYFAGEPLSYYYFSDLHSAILVRLSGNFFPRVLVYTNPVFAMTFFLSVYALAYLLTKKTRPAIYSAITATFFGNLMFVNFLRDINFPTLNSLSLIQNTLTHNSYTMDYKGLLQVAPMSDYFLQNRPMMIGLPGFVLIFLLSLIVYQNKSKKPLILTALITGLLFKFQLFSFVAGIFIFTLISLLHLTKSNFTKTISNLMVFAGIVLILISPFLFSSTNGSSLLNLFKQNFQIGPWDPLKNPLWFAKFTLVNFGPILPIAIVYSVANIRNKPNLVLFLPLLIFLTIPFTARFTIFDRDMFKFFYLMTVPLAILTAKALVRVEKKTKVLTSLSIAVIFTASFTSLLGLASSYLNRTTAYLQDDLTVGQWIRGNTNPKSVFISVPTVHTPITQIGGRLRVLSYINWPHSHGFNTGDDNVFTRLSDINTLYQNPTDANIISAMHKYSAQYIYYGPEEKKQFPKALMYLQNSSALSKVYSDNTVQIYKIK